MADQPLRTLEDLKAHELDVLQAIRSAPNGSNLFLADPFRFLRREHLPAAIATQPLQRVDCSRQGRLPDNPH